MARKTKKIYHSKKKIERIYLRMMRHLKRKRMIRYDWYDSGTRYDVFPGLYSEVRKDWGTDYAPVVTESLCCAYSLMYYERMIGNLIRMIIFDEFWQREKKTLYLNKLLSVFIILDGGNWDNTLLDAMLETQSCNLREAKHVIGKLSEENGGNGKKNWKDYFQKIILPIVLEIDRNGAWSELFKDNRDCEDDWKMVWEKLEPDEAYDIEIVRFLISDALFYVNGCNCNSYSPYWIFGSEHYEETMMMIHRRIKESKCSF